jgi:hypothetical protein
MEATMTITTLLTDYDGNMKQDAGETRCTDSTVERLRDEIRELEQIHRLDMAEIVRLRRMVEAVGEGRL